MERYALLLVIAPLLLTSCIGKKKHLEALNALKTSYDNRIDTLSGQLSGAEATIDQLTIQLAERRGANEALLLTQDRLQDRIDLLQEEIERLNSRASNQQESLSGLIQEKETELAACRRQLQQLAGTIDRWEKAGQELAVELQDSLRAFAGSGCAVETKGGAVVVVMQEDLLFRTGATGRIEARGVEVLDKISRVILKYPTLTVEVVGHTDNQPVQRKSVDNWDYSLLRAGTVVRMLTEEFDLGPNRVRAAGQSGFAPRTSNETSAGRTENRRVELLITPREEDLVRELRRTLSRS